MITRDYLHMAGLTKDQLAELVGLKTTSMITKKMDVEMPKRWARLLDVTSDSPAVDSDSSDARAHIPPTEDDVDWESLGRGSENDPERPEGAETVVGPQRIRLTTIEGYIQQIYGGAEYIARSRGDDIAADVIHRYTPEFAQAWVDYIQSDPRLLEYLERMMIGTPLGNLIGVHVIAIGSYAFARATARSITERFAEEQAANANGSVDESAGNFMG